MDLNEEKMEEYIERLSEDPNLVDTLPDYIVDALINYLQSEISNKEKLLEELQGE